MNESAMYIILITKQFFFAKQCNRIVIFSVYVYARFYFQNQFELSFYFGGHPRAKKPQSTNWFLQ
jgi:hypothetical protein